MEIKEAYVMSRTVEEDYFWIPGRLSPEAKSAYKKINENRFCDKYFSFVHVGESVHLFSNRINTDRRDHVHRKITDSILLGTDSFQTALRVYDGRGRLLEWSEEFFLSNGETGISKLTEIVNSVSPTITLDSFEIRDFGGVMVYTKKP